MRPPIQCAHSLPLNIFHLKSFAVAIFRVHLASINLFNLLNNMELAASAAGLAGLAGLTLQLAQVARECADIYSGMKEVGYTHDSILHSLRTEGLRLKRWEKAWGLDTGNTSSKQLQHLDPNDEQYRYAAAGLARIVYVFTKIAELQSKYQIEPETNDKKRIRDRLGVSKLFPRSRSKSPNPANTMISVFWKTQRPSPVHNCFQVYKKRLPP
ncbi:hypothetical protein BDZ91DRAFT_46134 [Kalaharituber pfeilii]|nr:hypothetical protein BDZ91DRAFT_46134 [Kalaharituber pfeilii]